LTCPERVLLATIIRHCNLDARCWLKHETMSTAARIPQGTERNAFIGLKKKGYIDPEMVKAHGYLPNGQRTHGPVNIINVVLSKLVPADRIDQQCQIVDTTQVRDDASAAPPAAPYGDLAGTNYTLNQAASAAGGSEECVNFSNSDQQQQASEGSPADADADHLMRKSPAADQAVSNESAEPPHTEPLAKALLEPGPLPVRAQAIAHVYVREFMPHRADISASHPLVTRHAVAALDALKAGDVPRLIVAAICNAADDIEFRKQPEHYQGLKQILFGLHAGKFSKGEASLIRREYAVGLRKKKKPALERVDDATVETLASMLSDEELQAKAKRERDAFMKHFDAITSGAMTIEDAVRLEQSFAEVA
jgi:hypothetical protein